MPPAVNQTEALPWQLQRGAFGLYGPPMLENCRIGADVRVAGSPRRCHMDKIENCTTCKHGEAHVYATGDASGKILCTYGRDKIYHGKIMSEPIRCVRYERNGK